jgi:hypothetical protein
MNVRAGTGWQTLFADISIILFMVTAAALSRAGDGTRKASADPSPRSDPVAVYRSAPGAPSLDAWLAAQPADPRQMLTIVASYRPGGQDAAIVSATGLARSASDRGMLSRIVVEPGDGDSAAMLAFDPPVQQLARSLRPVPRTSSKGTPP